MHAYILNALCMTLGLAVIAASAPALSSLGTPEDCFTPSTATIFVTVSASSPEPHTVYVTVPISSLEANLSDASTLTLTRFATHYSTATSPRISTKYISGPQKSSTDQLNDPYRSTITETTVITVTNVNLTPLLSGGSLTYTETPAPNGVLNYIFENGTTYWLNGQTPVPSESYVYATSSVTVVPVNPSEWASQHDPSTITLHSTIYYTKQFTLTEILESAVTSSGRNSANASSVRTGLSYTKPTGGWNATKTSSVGGGYSGAVNVVSAATGAGILGNGTPSLILYSSFDIDKTSHSSISLSSLAAKSGFNAFSTPASDPATTSIIDPAATILESSGQVTIEVIDGKTVNWEGSSGPTTLLKNCTETLYSSSATVPYTNSTSATSALATNTTSKVIKSLSSDSSNTWSRLSSLLKNPSASANTLPGVLSLLSTSVGSYTFKSAVISSGSSYNSSASASSTSSVLILGASTSLSFSASPALSSSFSRTVYSSSFTVPSIIGSSSTPSRATFDNFSSLVPSSASSSKSFASVSSTASTSPSLCGEHGDFVLNFDDIPPLSIGNLNPNAVQPEPVFNPYHQFDFSDGFVVVPPPTDPYLPSSPPLLLEFIPNFNVNGTNTQAGPNTAEEGYSGQISDGDGDRTGCFHFNVYGASFGCDSQGPPCDFTFSGYQLDASRNEVQIVSQLISVPACSALTNCTLTRVALDNAFENLAFVRINVTVAQQPKIWWMDDLHLGWYDNSCITSFCRVQTHLP